MARLLRRLGLLAALVLALAACGGGDDAGGGDADGSTTTASTGTTIAVDDGTETTTTTTAEGDDLMAQEGDFIRVHYIGTLDDGSVFDSSRDRGDTLNFIIGSGQMISGFDAGVRGMVVGETKTIRLEPAEAYGEVDPALFITVDLSQVPEGTEAGDLLQDPTSGQPVEVTEVTEDSATIDVNHPLAGEALTFEIEMIEVSR